MKNFGRALSDAFRFWPLLIVATLCSVGGGAIWGFNIGALLPVIEVTIAGESLQEWIDGEIADGQQRIADLKAEIAELRVGNQPQDNQLQAKIELMSAQLEAEKIGLQSSIEMKPYIDNYLPHDAFDTVLYVLVGVMLLTLLKHVFQYANTLLITLIAARITRRIQGKIFAKALSLDQASFAGHTSSGFVAHITYTTGMLSTGISAVFGGAIREPLKLLSCLATAAVICPRLLLLTMVVVPFVIVALYAINRSIKRVCSRLFQHALGIHHVMHESLNNIKTVQAYGQEGHEQERFDATTKIMQRFTMRMTSFNALNRPVTEILAIGMMVTAVVAGSYLVMNRATHILGIQITDQPLGAASLLVFFGLLVGASDPLRKFSTVVEGINSGNIAANLLYPLLDQESQIRSPDNAKTVKRPHESIRFENVSFAYEESNQILSDVSFEIPHGKNVAIVGPNGVGKSSLINLLCRFYDPGEGKICLDDVDIRDMDLDDVRGRMALVTQSTELFNEDVRYNIAYGAGEVSDEQIEAAARDAHAEDFIVNELSEKYETSVGQDGSRLSGGQRQRIALARALVRNPDILILDEATSQIDAASEQLIIDTIREQCRDRTVLFVTHGTAMLDLADVIIRVERGKLSIETRSNGATQSQQDNVAAA